MTFCNTLLVLFLILPNFAFSQFKIKEIVVSGNEVSSETIIAISGLSKSNNMSANSINEGFRRLSDSGLFQNVGLNPVGNRLIISVVENPIISNVDFEGNKILKINFYLSYQVRLEHLLVKVLLMRIFVKFCKFTEKKVDFKQQ